MNVTPDRNNRVALLWYFATVYCLCLLLIEFLGVWLALIPTAWICIGVACMTAWNIMPELPCTFAGHAIRLLWAVVWPVYAAARWLPGKTKRD